MPSHLIRTHITIFHTNDAMNMKSNTTCHINNHKNNQLAATHLPFLIKYRINWEEKFNKEINKFNDVVALLLFFLVSMIITFMCE